MPLAYKLFVYGAAMRGEARHDLLEGATFEGQATTEPVFDLIDLGADAAMAPGGRTAVEGELYTVPVGALAALDREAGHPILFRRTTVRLSNGRDADTYLLEPEQVRGRRRIRSGDWRARGSRARTTDGGPLVRWAR